MIKYYDSLDYNNIECELIENTSSVCEKGSIVPQITIDGRVEVNYFHYQSNSKYNVPKKIGGYKYFKEIDKYATEEYFKRLRRMNERPIFIWHITPNLWYNPKNINPIQAFKMLNVSHTIIVFGADLENKQDNNLIILNDTQRNTAIHKSGEYIYKNLLRDLKL